MSPDRRVGEMSAARWFLECTFYGSYKIYIYAFSRRFYPKRLTLHSSYSFYILKFENDSDTSGLSILGWVEML